MGSVKVTNTLHCSLLAGSNGKRQIPNEEVMLYNLLTLSAEVGRTLLILVTVVCLDKTTNNVHF